MNWLDQSFIEHHNWSFQNDNSTGYFFDMPAAYSDSDDSSDDNSDFAALCSEFGLEKQSGDHKIFDTLGGGASSQLDSPTLNTEPHEYLSFNEIEPLQLDSGETEQGPSKMSADAQPFIPQKYKNPREGLKTVYFGNLDPRVSRQLLVALCSMIGTVVDSRIVREFKRNKTYAFIEMASHKAAEQVLNELHGQKYIIFFAFPSFFLIFHS